MNFDLSPKSLFSHPSTVVPPYGAGKGTPVQSFPVKYCPPCVIALHHFVDYTGQAFHRVNLLTGQAKTQRTH